MKHYTYILLCADNTLYIGYTNDIDNRLEVHRSGKGSKYVRGRLPIKLIYKESFTKKEDAMKREYEIKQWPRAKKISTLDLKV